MVKTSLRHGSRENKYANKMSAGEGQAGKRVGAREK